jgi:type VII secretion protein EccE
VTERGAGVTQPPRVRAVARVGDESTRFGPARLRPRRRTGRIGPLHAIQLLIVEGVALAVLALVARGPVVVGGAAAVGLVLIVVSLARRRGRWWLESRLMTWQYRRRRRVQPDSGRTDARLGALRALAPGLAVANVAAPDGSPVGVGRDEAGWYAVAVVSAAAPMRDDPVAGLRVDRLARVVADAGHPGAILQIVTHTVTAPSIELDRDSLAGQSYRQLLDASGQVVLPRDRVTWIAVRLEAHTLAEESRVGGEDADPAVLTAALIRRVANLLRRTGRECDLLDAEGLVAALARSCDLEPPARTGSVRPAREDWAAWHSGPLAHTSFWVRDWPQVAEVAALLQGMSAVPATLNSVALILAPEDDSVDLRCLVRVAAPAELLAGVCESLVRGAEQMHAHLFRLDGEQGPAVYATAPTGGGPR